MCRVGGIRCDVASRPGPEQTVLVRLPSERQRIIGEAVDRCGHLDRTENTGAGRRADFNDLIVVAAGRQIGRIEECHVYAAIGSHNRHRDERFIEISRDDLRRRPRRPAVVSDRAEDSGADERAFLSQSKVAKGDDRVAVAPGGDVFLVEKIADAAEVAAAGGDANRCPRPAAVAGVGHEHVGVLRVGRPDESEAERRVVRVPGRVERDGRIARGLIGRSEQDREL